MKPNMQVWKKGVFFSGSRSESCTQSLTVKPFHGSKGPLDTSSEVVVKKPGKATATFKPPRRPSEVNIFGSK